MPLTDVLQWLDATGKHSTLVIELGDGVTRWLEVRSRLLVAANAPPARGTLATEGSAAAPGPGLRALTLESVYDLFLAQGGRFELVDDDDAPKKDAGVALEMSLSFLVMEGMRHLDEWPRIHAAYPDEGAHLHRNEGSAPDLGPIHAAIAEHAILEASLAETRLTLGLSRPALLRRVDELALLGVLSVDGSAPTRDLAAGLTEKASLLVREGQFEEAAHVLRSLVSTDAGDSKLRYLLEDVERRHLEACREEIPMTDLVALERAPHNRAAGGAEQALVECLKERPRSVAALVLVSPLRELETLVALRRLVRKGVLVIESGD